MSYRTCSKRGLASSLGAVLLLACGHDELHICYHAVNSTAELQQAVENGDPCGPPPGELGGSGAASPDFANGAIAASVCPVADPAQRRVAVSADGAKVAFLSCNGSSIGVVVQALSGGAPVELAPAAAGSSVAFTLDGNHVLFGAGGAWSVARADASRAPSALSAGSVEGYRLFRETVDQQGGGRALEPRLLVQELIGAERRIVARNPDTDYEQPLVILADADPTLVGSLIGGLEHLSDSGRTLVTPVQTDAGEIYYKLRTNAGETPFPMTYGPGEAEMGASGLGDTHNFAFMGDRLVRISLDANLTALADGDLTELASGGLLADHSQIIDRQDRPGVKYAHFIQNGAPSRRKREGDEPLQALATANATAQRLSPDSARILYLSDGAVFSVSAVGDGAALELVSDAGNRLRQAFAPDSSEVAIVGRGGRLSRSPLDRAGMAQLLDPERTAESWFGYSGDDSLPDSAVRLVWLSGSDEAVQDRLKVAPLGSGDASTLVSAGVSAWLAIPRSADILYVQGAELRRTTP